MAFSALSVGTKLISLFIVAIYEKNNDLSSIAITRWVEIGFTEMWYLHFMTQEDIKAR